MSKAFYYTIKGKYFQTLEDLAEASPIVITAQTKEKGEIFTYSDVEYLNFGLLVLDDPLVLIEGKK